MGAISDFVAQKLPSYLQKPMGQGFNRSFAQIADDLRGAATFLFKEALFVTATVDSYSAHLRNSNLQVVLGEAAAQTLAVLLSRWQQWRESGSVTGVVDALVRLGAPRAQVQLVTELDLRLAGVTNPFGGYRGFFFLIVPVPGLTAGVAWDSGWHWSGVPNVEPPTPWGGGPLSARATVLAMIAAIQKFKPAVTSCRFLVIPLDSSFSYSPTATPPFTGHYRIVSVWELWERRITGNGYPNEFYNRSFLVA